MSSPLEHIISAVHTICSETMELTLGCEVKRRGTQVKGNILWVTERPEGSVMVLDNKDFMGFQWIEDLEILGHPINIGHIMRALPTTGENQYAIHSNGRFMKAMGGVGKTAVHYAMTKIKYDTTKPLNEQSEETLIFLASNLPPYE